MSTKDGAGLIAYLAIIGMIVTALPSFVVVLWLISLLIPGKRLDDFLARRVLPWSIKLVRWKDRLSCLFFFKWRRK